MGFLPLDGNIGDRLIDAGAISLLRRLEIPFRILAERDLADRSLAGEIHHVFASGGGNLGTQYPVNPELRRKAVATGIPVTVLPQSMTDTGEDLGGFHRIWARERSTQRRIPGAGLAPDLALALDLPERRGDARRKLGMLLREDRESVFPDRDVSHGDPIEVCGSMAEYIEMIAGFRHVCTDRLHVAIAAMLMGRRVTLLPNSYYKNRSMYTTWLRDLGCEWADHPGEVGPARRGRLPRPLPEADKLLTTPGSRVRIDPGWSLTSGKNRSFLLATRDRSHRFRLTTDEVECWRRLRRSAVRYPVGDGGATEAMMRRLFNAHTLQVEAFRSPVRASRGSVGSIPGSGPLPIELTVLPTIEIDGVLVRSARVRIDKRVSDLWFEVGAGHRHRLGSNADPFLLATIFLGMQSGKPLWVRGAPASASLLDNLVDFQHVWQTWHRDYSVVPVYCEVEKGTVAGEDTLLSYSGGVDSVYSASVLSAGQPAATARRPPVAVMVHGLDIPVGKQYLFNDALDRGTGILARFGMDIIVVRTNARDFRFDWGCAHGAVTAAALSLVSNGAGLGLLPSTLNYGIMYPWGSTPMTDPMLSSASLAIRSHGAELTRAQKVRHLAGDPAIISRLRYCWRNTHGADNCGRCEKCVITNAMLLLAGVGDENIPGFRGKSALARRLREITVSRLDRSDLRFETEALRRVKRPSGWVKALRKQLEGDK